MTVLTEKPQHHCKENILKILPVPLVGSSTYRTNIENRTYTLNFRYEARSLTWYMDFIGPTGLVHTRNAKLVPNVPLLRRELPLGPSGNIYLNRINSNKGTYATANSVSPKGDFQLTYWSALELTLIDEVNSVS